MKKDLVYTSKTDGVSLHAYLEFDNNSAKGMVQILHGMAEHKERYDYFVKKLVENGYAESATMKGDFLDAFEKLLYNDRLRERMSAKIDEKNQREAIVRLFDFINKMMN